MRGSSKETLESDGNVDLFFMLFQQAQDGIFIVDPSGRFVDANPAGCSLLGYSREELLLLSPRDLIDPEDLKKNPFPSAQMTENQSVIAERHLRHKDGSLIIVEAHGQVLPDGRWLGVVRDLSERVRYQREIREMHDRLTTTLDHLLEGCQILSPDWTYLYVNDAVARHARKAKSELIHRNLFDVFPGFDETSAFVTMRRCMTERTTGRLINRFEYLDGTARWFELSIEPVPEGLFILSADITERRQSEEAIRVMNEELERTIAKRTSALSDLYNKAPCGYHSLDTNGVYVKVNETELEWLGYSREELIGKVTVKQLLTPESQRVFDEGFPMLKEKGFMNDLELDFIRKDGTVLPVLLSSTAIYDAEGRFVMNRSTMMNHAETRRIARKLKDSNEELEAFAYSVSHDLRAPLRGIDSYSRLLLERLGNTAGEDETRSLHRIVGEVEHMSGLIGALLHLSRINQKDLTVSLVDLRQKAAAILEPILESATQRAAIIDFHAEEGLLCEADEQLLDVVLTNLIENAVKYTSRREKAEIRITGFTEQGRQWFRVADNGAGFDPNYAQNLFKPFQRLHSASEFPGMGIGLATVRRIIRRHGGEIRARSRPDSGAAFEFTLTDSN